jgi:ferredoxin
MARILIGSGGDAVDAGPAVSILNAMLASGIPIRHDCGGRARCGTCRVRVTAGGEALSPKTRDEVERLEAIGAPPDYRLACQAHARKDTSIEIPEGSPPAGAF